MLEFFSYSENFYVPCRKTKQKKKESRKKIVDSYFQNSWKHVMSSLQNIPDNEGTTPLHYAAQAGHVEVVSFLLTKAQSTRIENSSL